MDQSQRWSAKSAGRRSHGYCDCSLRSRSVLLGLPFLASAFFGAREAKIAGDTLRLDTQDRKSTRLNSSHLVISYAVFCLKKKKNYNSVVCLLARKRYD